MLFKIVRTSKEDFVNRDYVAVATDLNFEHSFIVIKHKETFYIHHFFGNRPETIPLNARHFEIEKEPFHIPIEYIHPLEVPAFYARCLAISKNSDPYYGFYLGDSHFNKDGVFLQKKDVPNLMTCVGYCVYTLNGFNENDYINVSTWPILEEETINTYLEFYCKENNIDIREIASSHRRIPPVDFFTSGYLQNYPIDKNSIDSKRNTAIDDMNQRKTAALNENL